MLDFVREETRETTVEPVPVPQPSVKPLETNDTYGKFVMEPLRRGYGVTVGNPLRRVLLNSVPGAAVTWVRIEGVQHEYTAVPHVKEDVTELLLNIKAIRMRAKTERPGKLRLEVSGPGKVCAGDIVSSADFEIVNPELHLATLDSPEARLSIELNVEHGTGYVPGVQRNGMPIGVLPVDAVFSPVQKVNYTVERTRVGQQTDFERLLLEVWTDGAIAPLDAVRRASEILVNHFFLFSHLSEGQQEGDWAGKGLAVPAEVYNMPVEKLGLSARTLNCLKRAHVDKVGQILEMDRAELLRIRNFGDRSEQELYARLADIGLSPRAGEPQPAGKEAIAQAAEVATEGEEEEELEQEQE
ncbi:MAG: DNA-directed RNA polymerase subunit alpha [Chloroflexi bacterium]|nr:DNA-directed RNA polymerase subunit alpha [Chloroflexota bacterium]